jgi:hypothetical protein
VCRSPTAACAIAPCALATSHAPINAASRTGTSILRGLEGRSWCHVCRSPTAACAIAPCALATSHAPINAAVRDAPLGLRPHRVTRRWIVSRGRPSLKRRRQRHCHRRCPLPRPKSPAADPGESVRRCCHRQCLRTGPHSGQQLCRRQQHPLKRRPRRREIRFRLHRCLHVSPDLLLLLLRTGPPPQRAGGSSDRAGRIRRHLHLRRRYCPPLCASDCGSWAAAFGAPTLQCTTCGSSARSPDCCST